MKFSQHLFAGVCAIALAGVMTVAAADAQQRNPAGTTEYWLSAETSSGFGAGMTGGRGGSAAMMGALMGGRGKQEAYARNLMLQLGSPQRAVGEPTAEHLPPTGLQAGPALPLVSPKAVRPTGDANQPWASNMERPKGRILIYWGCGERARAGQPAVIDMSSLASGKAQQLMKTANVKFMTPPSSDRAGTYGEWPNERNGTRVPAAGSLVGAHVVRGNYTPEIRFSLAQNQDFLAPVQLLSNRSAPSGAMPLVWKPVAGAQAWFASTMGSNENGDLVVWTSSESQIFDMMSDYLPQTEINRLLQQRILLPASADRCTVPVEAVKAAPQAMLSVVAFGGEANFSHPARPAKAAASWKPEWAVKLRTKSTHRAMLGMNMPEFADDDDGADEAPAAEQQTQTRTKVRLPIPGLGRLLGN
nr:hypothetical protein [uncultured Sphingosinicella sp.]